MRALLATLARPVASLRGGDTLARAGLAIVIVLLLLALVGGFLAPFDPLRPAGAVLSPPSRLNPFGTDIFGRDVLSRVLHAFRLDLAIAGSAVLAATLIGLMLGGGAGYLGGRVDDVFMRLVDIVQSFPMLILAMALVALLGVGLVNVVLATAIVNIPVFARLARSQILAKRSLDYVEAARCSGASPLRILVVHLAPNILGPVVVQATLSLAWAVLNITALSFLGIGINPPTPELGLMIAEGARHLVSGAWWLSVFPGLALALTVFGFNLFGDALQDRFDPRRRGV